MIRDLVDLSEERKMFWLYQRKEEPEVCCNSIELLQHKDNSIILKSKCF